VVKRINRNEEEDITAKRRKTELQITLLEMDVHRKALEMLKLERELNLTPSKFTRDLVGSEITQIFIQEQ